MANAMTVGSHTPMVVLASSLVTGYERDEVDAVMAHELGHVLSDHVYYTTALVVLARFLAGSMPKPLIGLPVRGIYLVLLEWARAAELSSDRASALVLGDPLVPCRMLMRLAGGAIEGMSVDAFITQATDYHDEEDLFARWGRAWLEIGLTHPFAVRRVRELILWVQSGDYDRIRSGELCPPGSGAAADRRVRGGRGPLPGAVHRHGRPGHRGCAAAGVPARRLAPVTDLGGRRGGRRRRLRPALTSGPERPATASEARPGASKVAPSRAVAQLG